MNAPIALRESTATAPVRSGNRWRVIVATPGQGSSGYYSEEVLSRDAEKIIAPGGQSFINHDDSRNPKDMIGIYPDGSFWSEEDRAVVAELDIFSHWKQFVEEVGPHCGISLYALGESDGDNNITAIIEDRLNGADLVARPGLLGSGLAEKLYESAISAGDERPVVSSAQENRKETENMDLEQVGALLTALTDKVDSLVASKQVEAEQAAQAEVDAEAIAEAVDKALAAYDERVAAIESADILDHKREALRKLAREGKDIAAPLAEAVEDNIKAREAYAAGRVVEGRVYGSDNGADTSPIIEGWGK